MSIVAATVREHTTLVDRLRRRTPGRVADLRDAAAELQRHADRDKSSGIARQLRAQADALRAFPATVGSELSRYSIETMTPPPVDAHELLRALGETDAFDVAAVWPRAWQPTVQQSHEARVAGMPAALTPLALRTLLSVRQTPIGTSEYAWHANVFNKFSAAARFLLRLEVALAHPAPLRHPALRWIPGTRALPKFLASMRDDEDIAAFAPSAPLLLAPVDLTPNPIAAAEWDTLPLTNARQASALTAWMRYRTPSHQWSHVSNAIEGAIAFWRGYDARELARIATAWMGHALYLASESSTDEAVWPWLGGQETALSVAQSAVTYFDRAELPVWSARAHTHALRLEARAVLSECVDVALTYESPQSGSRSPLAAFQSRLINVIRAFYTDQVDLPRELLCVQVTLTLSMRDSLTADEIARRHSTAYAAAVAQGIADEAPRLIADLCYANRDYAAAYWWYVKAHAWSFAARMAHMCVVLDLRFATDFPSEWSGRAERARALAAESGDAGAASWPSTLPIRENVRARIDHKLAQMQL